MSKNCPPLLACPQFFFMLLRCKSANLGVIRTCAERLFVGASWSKKGRIHTVNLEKNTIRFAGHVAIPCNSMHFFPDATHQVSLYYQPKQCTIKREIPQNDHIFASSFKNPPKQMGFSNDPLGTHIATQTF